MVDYMTREMISDDELDRPMDRIDADGLELLEPDGVLTDLTSRIMNRAMDAELTHELDYGISSGDASAASDCPCSGTA